MAPEWQRPEELGRLVEALRFTEDRPTRRWSDLVALARRAREQGAISTTELWGSAG